MAMPAAAHPKAVSPLRRLARGALRTVLAGLLALGTLAANALPPAVTPPYPLQRLEIKAVAAPLLNRDPAGHPLSVVVRVYQLRDKEAFSKLTFEQVTSGRSDADLLGQDFLGRSEFTLAPGALHDRSEPFLPDTHYLGVVALFRHPEPQHWRCLTRVEPPRTQAPAPPPPRPWYLRPFTRKPKLEPPPKNQRLAFQVHDCFLTLIHPAAEPLPGQPKAFKPDCGSAPVLAPEAEAPAPGKEERSLFRVLQASL
jgi:type VI secretion system protein VasD